MKDQDRVTIAAMAAAFLMVAGTVVGPAALAIKSDVDVEVSAPALQKLPPGYVKFHSIPLSHPDILLLVENARVTVKRSAGGNEIVVASNCPGNWNVKGALIRQAGIAGKKGASITADALGSRAILNGRVYLLPDGKVSGMQMKAEGVFVNGEKIDPLPGSGSGGDCTGADELAVFVPDSYSGNLSVGAGGQSELSVNSWKGGTISCTLVGRSSLVAENLDSLTKAVVDNRGSGKAEITGLSARAFVANLQGSGSVVVTEGRADMSNATVAGPGTMTLRGDFKNLKQSVEGKGSIDISK